MISVIFTFSFVHRYKDRNKLYATGTSGMHESETFDGREGKVRLVCMSRKLLMEVFCHSFKDFKPVSTSILNKKDQYVPN